MTDLTVVFLTTNRFPKAWSDYHADHLTRAAKGCELISVSRLPSDIGTNLIQTEPFSAHNIYRQMLRAARLATTPYIAVAEDDILYAYEHFHALRPKENQVAYNLSRWSVLTWDPLYSWRNRVGNGGLIAPRDYLIEALEERFAKWPTDCPSDLVGEIGRPMVERNLKLTPRNMTTYYSAVPIIQVCHEVGGKKRKRHGPLKAIEIPYWGRAADLITTL